VSPKVALSFSTYPRTKSNTLAFCRTKEHPRPLTSHSCAAKHKSSKALRGDHTLFEHLSKIIVNTTNEITTTLVLPLDRSSLRVESDRAVIHHDILGGIINIYVPDDKRERRACYRSQLPNLLKMILDVGSTATFNISSIVCASLADLDDVLIEQDIPTVEWVEKPVLVFPDAPGDERPSTPIPAVALSDATEAPASRLERSGSITPAATPTQQVRAVSVVSEEDPIETALPEQYPDLIEQVVRSAQHAVSSRGNAGVYATDAPSNDGRDRHFEHLRTFGRRDTNTFVHDRRIGAVGEAYVRFCFTDAPHTEFDLTHTLGLRDPERLKPAQLLIGELAQYNPWRTCGFYTLCRLGKLGWPRNGRHCVPRRHRSLNPLPPAKQRGCVSTSDPRTQKFCIAPD
jgi:hypothetical protein